MIMKRRRRNDNNNDDNNGTYRSKDKEREKKGVKSSKNDKIK